MQMNKNRIILIFQIFLAFNWIVFLQGSDSYLVPYMLVGIMGIISLILSRDDSTSMFSRTERLELIMSGVFSALVLIANYPMFDRIVLPDVGDRIPASFFLQCAYVFIIPTVFAGGFLCSFYILQLIKRCIRSETLGFILVDREHPRGTIVYSIAFLHISAIYLILFFLAFYPGVLTSDSINTIREIMSGEISNLSPFYHTWIIRLCMLAGKFFFGDINASVATFVVFQILVVSAVYAWMALTLYEMRLSITSVIAIMTIHVFLPYNIAHTMAIWKEALFGCSILAFIISFVRCMNDLGNRKLNYIMLSISGFGMCLFRHNGFYSFILCVAAFILLYRRKYIRMVILLICILTVSYLLMNPIRVKLSSGYDTSDPSMTLGIISSLSVPMQQMARVYCDCDDMTQDQKERLSHIMNVDKLRDTYQWYIFDPVRELIYEVDGDKYASEHPLEVIQLYFELGIQQPKAYIKAWVDQTYGYWNGGNWYWFWATGLVGNDLGIFPDRGSELIESLTDAYLQCFTNVQILIPFISIGLYTWINIAILYMGFCKHNKEIVFATIVPLTLILILCICSPVFSENRYAYPMMEAIPFLIVYGIWAPNNGLSNE